MTGRNQEVASLGNQEVLRLGEILDDIGMTPQDLLHEARLDAYNPRGNYGNIKGRHGAWRGVFQTQVLHRLFSGQSVRREFVLDNRGDLSLGMRNIYRTLRKQLLFQDYDNKALTPSEWRRENDQYITGILGVEDSESRIGLPVGFLDKDYIPRSLADAHGQIQDFSTFFGNAWEREVVITGGPYSGKSTFLIAMKDYFKSVGLGVLYIDCSKFDNERVSMPDYLVLLQGAITEAMGKEGDRFGRHVPTMEDFSREFKGGRSIAILDSVERAGGIQYSPVNLVKAETAKLLRRGSGIRFITSVQPRSSLGDLREYRNAGYGIYHLQPFGANEVDLLRHSFRLPYYLVQPMIDQYGTHPLLLQAAMRYYAAHEDESGSDLMTQTFQHIKRASEPYLADMKRRINRVVSSDAEVAKAWYKVMEAQSNGLNIHDLGTDALQLLQSNDLISVERGRVYASSPVYKEWTYGGRYPLN